MYLGVDVGGTKTLVAVLDGHGVIVESRKFPTPKKYDHWLLELANTLAHFEHHDFSAGAAGIPASSIDRRHGRGLQFGNLPWKNVPIEADLQRLIHAPVVIENDAKLAGLSESRLIKDDYSRVLYVTVSTGIGYSFILDGVIDTNIGDAGGKFVLVEHQGKLVPWESFASGRAIVERRGKMAKDIHDQATWRLICRDLAKGLIELIALTEPEVIVFGGSVGTYFDRYHILLADELKRYQVPLLKLPALRQAQRPEQAVVYGCYDIARHKFKHAETH